MTLAETEKKKNSIGNTVLFSLIMAVLTVASFVVSIVSDYVKVGFDFSFLASFSYWANLIANNIINIALAIVFRSVMLDRERRTNYELTAASVDITQAQKFIYSSKKDGAFRVYVDKVNAERKYKMYCDILKRKIDRSRAKKKIDLYNTKIGYEKEKSKPDPEKLKKYENAIKKYTAQYNTMLKKLDTAREDSEWKKVRGYRPIRVAILFSTAEKMSDHTAENYEVNNAKEFWFFFFKRVVCLLLFSTFLGTLVPQGFEFNYGLLWSTANKVFWGAMSLYMGGQSGVEYVRQVLIPAVKGRVDFIQQACETLENTDKTVLG